MPKVAKRMAVAGSLLVRAVTRTQFFPRRRRVCLAEIPRLEQVEVYLLFSLEAESSDSSQGLSQCGLHPGAMKRGFGRRQSG
jgi:hypothetical protein